jgi:hypothetical protein
VLRRREDVGRLWRVLDIPVFPENCVDLAFCCIQSVGGSRSMRDGAATNTGLLWSSRLSETFGGSKWIQTTVCWSHHVLLVRILLP